MCKPQKKKKEKKKNVRTVVVVQENAGDSKVSHHRKPYDPSKYLDIRELSMPRFAIASHLLFYCTVQ